MYKYKENNKINDDYKCKYLGFVNAIRKYKGKTA